MKIDLSGRRALVMGASQGIGRATALAFAECGAQITAVARSQERLGQLLEELPGSGHGFIALDLSDRTALQAQIEAEIGQRGYDILVCNTGGPAGGPISQASEAEFLAAFQNHLLVNALLVRLVLPHMKAQKFGRILTITSTSVKMPIPHLGVSNTIRAAVSSWAKTLSMEVAPFGITVNNVLPGYTRTARLESLLKAQASKGQSTVDAVSEQWKNSVPMNRFGEPEELASALAFLASPLASYITGVSLPVDGGRIGCL